MKKVISLVLIMSLFISFTSAFAVEGSIIDGKPEILIAGIEYPEVVSKGEEFDVAISFKNTGEFYAYNLTYALEFVDYNGSNPVSIIDSPQVLDANTWHRQNINLRMKVSEDANIGDYKMTLKIDYKDQYGSTYNSSSVTRPIKIDLGKTNPEIVVNDVDISPGGSGRYQATFTYQNMGEKEAANLTANFNGEGNYLVVDTSSKKHLGDLPGKRTGTVSFLIQEKDGIVDETATLEFSFEDENKNSVSQNLQVYLGTGGASGTAGKTPWVIVNKYTLSSEQVYAGNRVVLSLFIENTNPKPVKNLKLSLGVIKVEDETVGGTVFSPVNSSNTFFIENIEGQSVVRKDIEIFVDPNASAKTYIVPLDIVYEDERGKQLSVEELINIPVIQNAMLEILSVDYPKEAALGEMINIVSEFVNVGKVNLSNFRVNIEGDFGKDNTLYYVGNLEMGISDYYQGRIIPEEEGPLEGKVVYTYLDASNEEVRVEKDFEINVGPMREPEPMPEDMGGEFPGGPGMEEPKEINWLLIILGIVILGQGFAIFKMKRNKSKEDFYE